MLVLLFDDSPIMYSSLIKFFDDSFGCLMFLSYEQKLPSSWGV
jgi:hypothetical protein